MQTPQLSVISQRLAREGFTALGSFLVRESDAVPAENARYAVLAGNAGADMFARFSKDCNRLEDRLDTWCRQVIDPIGHELGARVMYPFDRPALPFQKWARRAGAGFVSPLGLNIHPEYGLWHAYRALLVFDKIPADSDLPRMVGRSPCDACATRPCLQACPVRAFDGKQFNAGLCRIYLMKRRGRDCLNNGCKARLACPAGKRYRYDREQMQFHMAAFAVPV